MTKHKESDSQGTIVVLTDQYIDYPKLVVDNIAAVLREHGYGLLCITGRELSLDDGTDHPHAVCNAIYSLVSQHNVKGLISISGSIGHTVDLDTLSAFLDQFQIPKISLGIAVPGIPAVLIDDLNGMKQLMDHLLSDPSRQNIAYIRGYPNDPYSRRREQIFRDALKAHNRACNEKLFVEGNYDKFETYSAVAQLLDADPEIDAFVAANDLMALSAARAISAKGMRIPQDIAVTGFDDTREATQYSPALTTVRQPIETIAENCVNTLIATMETYTAPSSGDVAHTPAVKLVKNELIKRGSTLIAAQVDNNSLALTIEDICTWLNVSLAGLVLPPNVDIAEVARVYWHSVKNGSSCLLEYFESHLDSSIAFEHIHWWSNLCYQLEYHTAPLLKHFGRQQYESQIIAILADARERAWSVSLDHEFELHRWENVQNRMQLQMSSCVESDDILVVLTDWLVTLGAKRCFLARLVLPDQTPGEWAELVHAFRDGKVEACQDLHFRTRNLLPATLRDELGSGLLVMCPVHAGDKLFGYILLDPEGLDHLDLEATSNSIGNAMRGQFLIQSLERQTASLQTANQELYTLAQYDALTGLPNRLNFQQRLSSQCKLSIDNQNQFALMFIDLDGFKHINDTLGHDAGDHLLKAVAQRLHELIDHLDLQHVFVARLGGDEFTVIVDYVKAQINIVIFVEQILDILSNTFSLEKQTVTVSASVGCAFFPADGSVAKTLVKHADTAMYHAKAQGKNCMAFFKPEMSISDSRFLRLDQEMRSAISNDVFCVHFQPKIDLKTGLICGVEALMRWLIDTPDGLRIHANPDEFIPVAESTGFITQLDLTALEQSCSLARRWEVAGVPLPVAVNLSVVFLQKDNMVELVSEVIRKHQLTPSLLEFEITESAVMTEVETNIVKLSQLRDMGIRISIDDFGTGYSSLSYLKKLPINCLKIDRSFISDLNSDDEGESVDAAIVRSVIALGKSLDLALIAEGVETRAQLDIVTQMGCEQAQGFFFAKPLPLAELESYLSSHCQHSVAA